MKIGAIREVAIDGGRGRSISISTDDATVKVRLDGAVST